LSGLEMREDADGLRKRTVDRTVVTAHGNVRGYRCGIREEATGK
jgi:hypothetical protein